MTSVLSSTSRAVRVAPALPRTSRFLLRLRAIAKSKQTMQLICARVRARHGVLQVEPGHDDGIGPDVAKTAQWPAPLRSQDSRRRLLPGQSGAGQGALPLPRRQIDGPEDTGWSCTDRRGPATGVARLSSESSGGQKRRRSRISNLSSCWSKQASLHRNAIRTGTVTRLERLSEAAAAHRTSGMVPPTGVLVLIAALS